MARRRVATSCSALSATWCALLLSTTLGACSSAGQDALAPVGAGAAPFAGSAPLALVGTAWDHFRHQTAVTWACRDLATGEIVSSSMCHALPMHDRQWPGMAVPPSYRGMPDP